MNDTTRAELELSVQQRRILKAVERACRQHPGDWLSADRLFPGKVNAAEQRAFAALIDLDAFGPEFQLDSAATAARIPQLNLF